MGQLGIAEKRRNPATQDSRRRLVRWLDSATSDGGWSWYFKTKVAWWWCSYIGGACIKKVAKNVSHD